MDFGEVAHAARHDQVQAAHADVVDILAMIARERQRWSRVDESTNVRIEALLEGLFAEDSDPADVCRHARRAAFDRAPRPLVLDSRRRILACWEACYWRAVSTWAPGRGPDATCFDCGRRLGASAGGSDLFIAYGPILVVGALCQRCQDRTSSRSTPAGSDT